MSEVDEYGRTHPPLADGELASLLGFLDYQRETLAWKCADVDAAGLGLRVAASSMTLGGLLKHMALVEDDWFQRDLHSRELGEPWSAHERPGRWAWESAPHDSPAQLLALWRASVERSRAAVAEALADGGLDRLTADVLADGRRPNLRWILLHMIEEYARHNGHADLLREAVDGSVGE